MTLRKGQELSIILAGETPRQALSRARNALKCEEVSVSDLEKDIDEISSLLFSEDAKTRKNAALLIKDLSYSEKNHNLNDVLIKSFQEEKTLYVRPSICQAIYACLPLSSYEEIFSKRKNEIEEGLKAGVFAESDRSHLNEELHMISTALSKGKKHEVTHFNHSYQIVLTCNKSAIPELRHELGPKTKELTYGLRAGVSDLNKLMKLRTFKDVLFMIPIKKGYVAKLETIGSLPENSALIKLVEDLFSATGDSFRFRISGGGLLTDGKAIRKIGAEIEDSSGRRLINSPSDYEFELVLKPGLEGRIKTFVRIPGIDKRFSYRKYTEAQSMSGYLAALSVSLMKKYFKGNAQIIDAFCGSGTLIIERALAGGAKAIYGTDTYGLAVKEARANAELAGVDINFINRSYFDFTSDYKFDEILGQFPDFFGKDQSEKNDFYDKFFEESLKIADENAFLFLISRDQNQIKRSVRKFGLKYVSEEELSKDEKLYILEVVK